MHASAPPRTMRTSTSLGYLGHKTYSAARNMALDEAMGLQSAATGKAFLRFYDFERPSIVLCEHDSTDCLKLDNLEGVDITRRKSSGRPIYISSNVLSYSISLPYAEVTGWGTALKEVHQHFGGLTADAIAEVAGVDRSELTLPRTSSIRFDNRPIAGHAQSMVLGRYLLYHGIITVAAWPIDEIDRHWRLESEDLQRIEELPSVMGIARKSVGDLSKVKSDLIAAMLNSLSGGNFDNVGKKETVEMMEIVEALVKDTYGNMSWVLRPDATRTHNLPFCILWEENETPKQRK